MAKDYVVTPPFRVSFPAVFEPRGFEDQEPKYSVTMMFPKETNLKELEDLVSAVAEEKWGKKVKKFRTPFRDGDEKEREEYTGQILVNAKSKTKPTIVDQRKRPITSEEDFYPGCWARAALTCYAYGSPGKAISPGVAFGLQLLQKVKDDEPFRKQVSVDEAFDELEVETEELADEDLF